MIDSHRSELTCIKCLAVKNQYPHMPEDAIANHHYLYHLDTKEIMVEFVRFTGWIHGKFYFRKKFKPIEAKKVGLL